MILRFLISFFSVFLLDQSIKYAFLKGFHFNGKCISLVLTFNKGVAFSMFSFLGSYLKYIQLLLIFGLFLYFIKEKIIKSHPMISGILFGAAFSNLFDRFVRGGVVDYVYWHCGFKFAVFNFADVSIDFAVLMFAYFYFFGKISSK
jgi:signal peptidase II